MIKFHNIFCQMLSLFLCWPHKHPVNETYSFTRLGLDQGEDPKDFGRTVEFWIGEGAEAEKFIINKPTTILVLKNTVHFPAYVTDGYKSFMMLTVTDMPLWGAKWVKKLPPDFGHAKSS